MSSIQPDTSQSGQVITEGPESPYQDAGIPVPGNVDDDVPASAYTVSVATRVFRTTEGGDGWNFQASRTPITVNRGRYNTTV